MRWRPYELDDALLSFDRRTGTNVLVENARTKGLRRRAPRTVQVSLTNACNKACAFCYRPAGAPSLFTFESLLELARFCDAWGVLELAFGGGEPTLFPRFVELMRAIWQQTGLCPSFTTNGLRLRETNLLRELGDAYGQVQLSVYEEDEPLALVDFLAAERARFGLNYLVTPARVRTLELDLVTFASRGARDVLVLSYKGDDPALHLDDDDCRRLDDSLLALHERLGAQLQLKVDVCWGDRLPRAPRLLATRDCEAGDDFLSITSDRRVHGCSFATGGVAFDDVRELRGLWEGLRARKPAAEVRGCTRGATT